MITAAKNGGPALWVGPTPVIADMMPINRLPGISYDFQNPMIETYSQAYAKQAAELGVPYLDLHSNLAGDPDWDASLRASDGLHPNCHLDATDADAAPLRGRLPVLPHHDNLHTVQRT